jgi:hypothetical protein
MAIAQWFNSKLPSGLYGGPLKRSLAWCDKRFSLNNWYDKRIRMKLCMAPDAKSPQWVAEVYQLGSFCVALVLLVLAGFLPRWLSVIVAAFALYRPFEILIFAINWVFIHSDPLHSYKRSLVSFLINIAEVVVFCAAASLGFGFVTCSSYEGGPRLILAALYSSLRTTVTIGPTSLTTEPPNSLWSGILLMSQIAASFFLAIVVIAHLAGALRERLTTKNNAGPPAQPVVLPSKEPPIEFKPAPANPA